MQILHLNFKKVEENDVVTFTSQLSATNNF